VGDAWLEANGVVCDPSGAPIVGARVTLGPAPDFKDARFVRMEEGTTNRDGKFTVPSGTFAPFSNPRFILRIEKKGLKPYESLLTGDARDLKIILAPIQDAERRQPE
jgi:hypothetical protein